MENIEKPTILKIIQVDYIASLTVTFPLVTWGLYLAISYFGFLPSLRGRGPMQAEENAPIFFALGIAALVIGIPVLIWRVRLIQGIFVSGAKVTGRITDIIFHKGRGRIRYAYDYEDQTYQTGNAIQKNKKTRAVQFGDEVLVAVDPLNPKSAFVQELYI